MINEILKLSLYCYGIWINGRDLQRNYLKRETKSGQKNPYADEALNRKKQNV